MKFNQILRQMGAGEHPSDDEKEATQRVQWELEQDKLTEKRNAEIAQGIKECKTIADLLKYLYASVESIHGSRQAYSGQELAMRVLNAVRQIRKDHPDPAQIRSIDEKLWASALRMKPHNVTDGCGLATHLAKLIHKIELGDDFEQVARVIENASGTQSRPVVSSERKDTPVARTDKPIAPRQEEQVEQGPVEKQKSRTDALQERLARLQDAIAVARAYRAWVSENWHGDVGKFELADMIIFAERFAQLDGRFARSLEREKKDMQANQDDRENAWAFYRFMDEYAGGIERDAARTQR